MREIFFGHCHEGGRYKSDYILSQGVKNAIKEFEMLTSDLMRWVAEALKEA